MTIQRLTAEVWGDAGLLREYASATYGERYYSPSGLSGAAFGRMLRMVDRLCDLTGRSRMSIINEDFREDYEAGQGN